LKKRHILTRLAKERASFLKIIDINDISFFGMPNGNANSMGEPLPIKKNRKRKLNLNQSNSKIIANENEFVKSGYKIV
jgi:hypothetical protein